MYIPRTIPAAIALVLAWAAPGAAQTFSFSKSFPASASSALDVRTTNGKITVTAGTGSTIEVRVPRR